MIQDSSLQSFLHAASTLALAVAMFAITFLQSRRLPLVRRSCAATLPGHGQTHATLAILIPFLIGIGVVLPDARLPSALGAAGYGVGVSSVLSWRISRNRANGRLRTVDLPAGPPNSSESLRLLCPAWIGMGTGIVCLLAWSMVAFSPVGDHFRAAAWAVGAFTICPTIVALGLIASIVGSRAALALPEHPRRAQLAPLLSPLVAMSWYAHREERTRTT